MGVKVCGKNAGVEMVGGRCGVSVGVVRLIGNGVGDKSATLLKICNVALKVSVSLVNSL